MLIIPSSRNSTYCGTSVTSPGSGIVASTITKSTDVPRTRMRAKANPASELVKTVATIGMMVVSSELPRYFQKGKVLSAWA